MSRSSLAAVAVLASVVLPSMAVAQSVTQAGSPAAAVPAAPAREGLWFNVGLGGGALGCDACEGREASVSGALAVGGTLTQRVLIGGGTTGWTKSVNGVSSTVGSLNAMMRFYPSATNGFFLLGGAGLGTIRGSNGTTTSSETGGSAIVGVGTDFRVGRNTSVTPFGNWFAVKTENGNSNVVQIGAGVTLH